MIYSGGSDGNVFVWSGTTLQKTVKAHEGPLFAMHSLDKVCNFLYSQLLYIAEPSHEKTNNLGFRPGSTNWPVQSQKQA